MSPAEVIPSKVLTHCQGQRCTQTRHLKFRKAFIPLLSYSTQFLTEHSYFSATQIMLAYYRKHHVTITKLSALQRQVLKTRRAWLQGEGVGLWNYRHESTSAWCYWSSCEVSKCTPVTLFCGYPSKQSCQSFTAHGVICCRPEWVVPLLLCFSVRQGQGSVTDRNACEHALLGGMHGGIEGAWVGGPLLSDQNALVCYNWHVWCFCCEPL